MPDRFLAVVGETSVLVAVAVLASAGPDDEVLLLQDPHARRRGQGSRLQAVLRRHGLAVELKDIGSGPAAPELAACLPARKTPGNDVLVAIGGRARDRLMWFDMLRRRAWAAGRGLQAITLGESPPCVEQLFLSPSEDPHSAKRPLHAGGPDSLVGLDDVLHIQGYRRSKAKPGRLIDLSADPGTDSGFDAHDPGARFEHRVLREFVRLLPGGHRRQVAEVWHGVEVCTTGRHTVATEFDLLLVMRDGRAVHLECKSGRHETRDIQAKLLQLRNIFTPHSGFVLCKSAPDRAVQGQRMANDLRDRFAHLGRFGIWLVHPRGLSRAEDLAQALRDA